MISAIGPLEVLKFPDVPGIDDFKGNLFHAGKWDHSVDLKGKKVAVVGNATSAYVECLNLQRLETEVEYSAQIVPTISEDPSVMVTNFCRTPSWFFPSVRL